MNYPINRKKQIITYPFKGYEYPEHKRHLGIDLRSVNFATRKKQAIILPEECLILRISTEDGFDWYGNDYIVLKPMHDSIEICDELKFIHLHFAENFVKNEILEKGCELGYTAVRNEYSPRRSNSTAHHLHFETHWRKRAYNPLIYLDFMSIKWRYKWQI